MRHYFEHDQGLRCTILLQILSFILATLPAQGEKFAILLGAVFISAYIFGLFERNVCADHEEHLGRTIAMACVASGVAFVIQANSYTALLLLLLPPAACALGRWLFTSKMFKRQVLWISFNNDHNTWLSNNDCYSPIIVHYTPSMCEHMPLTQLCAEHSINEIVLDTPMTHVLGAQLLLCRMQGIRIFSKHAFVTREKKCLDLTNLYESNFIFNEDMPLSRRTQYIKRLCDILFALVIGLLLLPLLLLGIWLVWREKDGGRLFYSQTRVGLYGKHFTIYKLRTMTPTAEQNGAVWAQKNDSRITRAGRFLRRTRIDEIPQLWCILRGDMSLVGPRPERPEFTTQLAQEIDYYNDRHCIRPGLTGWAQLYMHYTNTTQDTRLKLSYDLYYVKNMSLWLDFAILLKTGRVLFFTNNAY